MPAKQPHRDPSTRHSCGFVLLALAAVVAGCATPPPGPTPQSIPAKSAATSSAAAPARDGAEPDPPPGLASVPDAEPTLEPIRVGGPNKPYEVLGQAYVPITQDQPFTERGLASWYGRKFHGRRTASGEVYNMYAMTAAHPTLPIPSYARVRNPANGREVVVRINDRGPFHAGRVLDLSYTAALRLDLLRGVAPVALSRITFDEIRSGAWRQDRADPGTPPAVVVAVAPAGDATAAAAPPVPASGAAAAAAPAPAPAAAALTVADAPAERAYTRPARGFWVQLGAFRLRDGAETFHRRVATEADWLAPLLAVFVDATLYRLQAGPYPSRDQARGVAERVRGGLQLVPTIVERR